MTIAAVGIAISWTASSTRPAGGAPRQSSDLAAQLRPIILQTLNESGGPEFAIEATTLPLDRPQPATTTGFRAPNATHRFTVEYSNAAIGIVPEAAPQTPLRLTLTEYGAASRLEPAAMGDWQSRGARIERTSRAGLAITEWYVNGPVGLEQGFVVHAAPRGGGPLTVAMAVDRRWSVQALEPGQSVAFVEPNSGTTLTYGELYAFDADGRPLAAQLDVTADGVSIEVDARDARYPVTIDPFVQQQALTVAGVAAGDEFGFSVALDETGTTAVVGVPGRDTGVSGIGVNLSFPDNGIAYVFARTGDTWQLQSTLGPSSGGIVNSLLGQAGRRFGHAVAISGNTIVVTAPFEDVDGRTDNGAAYVFQRSGAGWTFAQRIAPASIPNLGRVVAIDGGLMALAAGDSGLRVFAIQGGAWFDQGTPLPVSGSPGLPQPPPIRLGGVAVSGNAIVVGQPDVSPPAFKVLSHLGLNFQSVSITVPSAVPSDRAGESLAVSGDALLIGAPGASNGRGAGYVFRGGGAGWTFEQKLDVPPGEAAGVGVSAAISETAVGGRVAALGTTTGVAIFRRTASSWIKQETLGGHQQTRALGVGVDPLTAVPILLRGGPLDSATGRAVVFTDVPSAPPSPSPPPSPPPNGSLAPPTLAAAIVTGSTVQLNWSAGSGATSYRLRAGTVPGGSNAFDGNVGAMTTLTAVTVPNGTYFARVHSVSGSAESGPSNEVRIDVGPASSCSPATGPTNFRATVNGQVVTLLWNAAPGAVGYTIEAGSASGLSNLAIVNLGAVTTFMASAPPGTYFVRARMRNACGATAVSNEIVVQVG